MEDFIASLSLEEAEEESIQLRVESSDSETSYANYFVGVFLTSSVVHFQSMRLTLANVWYPIGGVSISDLENDVDRVEKNSLWNFNSHLLVLRRLKQRENPLTVQLLEVDFWTLIHNLPHSFMSEIVVRWLGNFIETFLEYDTSTVQMGYRGIMRLRKNCGVEEQVAGRGRGGKVSNYGVSVVFRMESTLTLMGEVGDYLCGGKMIAMCRSDRIRKVIEDFNKIAYSSEKQGGLVRRESQMKRFREMLSDYSLSYLGYLGQWFT
ncbi:hypothetical protein CXB51_014281 [Gossypium anomalum]|uniref:DUF4283 domain-containing protein n=1 Tax=Gossypium anomalum TaxID=47600 RepID=A0A8J5Z9Z2_9ROSI|nr:hypothetical protein CXB51_014281 [Gossypium anomalum]